MEVLVLALGILLGALVLLGGYLLALWIFGPIQPTEWLRVARTLWVGLVLCVIVPALVFYTITALLPAVALLVAAVGGLLGQPPYAR